MRLRPNLAAMGRFLLPILILMLIAGPLQARPLVTEIHGVEGEMLANVRAALSLVQAESYEQVAVWRLRQMSLEARDEARDALRPFGYYQSRVDVRLEEPDSEGQPWRARVDIELGEPVRVREPRLQIVGEGSNEQAFREWLAAWPLPEGAQLRHPVYTQALRELESIAQVHGYFQSRFPRREVRVDPGRNTARVNVNYDTGERYRIGRVDFGDTDFSDRLMDRLTVLEGGAHYHADDVDRQRQVLARSQYFSSFVIEEDRRDEDAEVDFAYRLEPRLPNTYRVLAGFGTDTGPRLQLGWTRHYLSSRGNRIDTQFGVQERNREYVFQSEYQHPFGRGPGDFLTGKVFLRRQNDNFRFRDENRIEPVFEAFTGSREQVELTAGRLRERSFWPEQFNPLQERLFLAFLHERFDVFREARFSEEQEALLAQNPELAPFLDTDTNTIALGGEWLLYSMQGEGFATEGKRFSARVLGAHESLGSDVSFLQGYLSGRWHWLMAPRHKLLVRGEIGYTEADTTTLDVSLEGDERFLRLNITDLPELYRFKTGGDRTVRGYGFETLSTNRNGANHILTGSVEYEFKVFGDWSVAAFYDTGNAFNDWGTRKLKSGAGIGVRWYTLIGPVQLDLARPLDDRDTEIRIHFTIGTKLL